MLKRTLLIALLGVSIASAKSYTFTVSDAAHAGNIQLAPGQYTLKLEGSQVVLLDRNGKKIEASAKVEPADKKYDYTAVFLSKEDGKNKIQWITLAGSKNKVVFE